MGRWVFSKVQPEVCEQQIIFYVQFHLRKVFLNFTKPEFLTDLGPASE